MIIIMNDFNYNNKTLAQSSTLQGELKELKSNNNNNNNNKLIK